MPNVARRRYIHRRIRHAPGPPRSKGVAGVKSRINQRTRLPKRRTGRSS